MSRYGKTRASFDSEGTSIGLSPPQSPRHPVYFVQSPSRESNDGDAKPSFQSTPVLSPSSSPLHQSFIRSSAPRASQVHCNPTCLPGSHSSARAPKAAVSEKKRYKPWSGITEEEEEDDDDDDVPKKHGLSRWCMFGLSFLFCILLFSIGAFIFWFVCQPRSPNLIVKDVVFSELFVVEGSDDGVPTRILTANCTLQLSFHNPSNYFGVHVSNSDINLDYSGLSVGKGQIGAFYAEKKSKRVMKVNVVAVKVPLYGAGPNLQSLTETGGGVPVEIRSTIESHAYVLWKLIKPKFRNYFSCDVTVNSSGKDFLKLLYKICSYTPPK